MKVMLRGVVYDTIKEAAEAFNVKERTIRRVLNEGREDTIQVKRADCKRGRPEPFSIEGLTFPNQKAANDALGLPFNYITQAINRNRPKSLEKVAAVARAYKEMKE
jgi:hypothetical protein